MNFPTAIKTCFKKYWVCSDRASRSEYWWWTLFTLLATLGLMVADVIVFSVPLDSDSGGPLNAIFTLVTFMPSFLVMIRRLHDVDRSGYWWLIWFTIIGLIPLLYWLIIKGTTGPNRFGPDPLAPQMIG